MISKFTQRISNFFLYGVIFSLAAFISSLFTDGEYTMKPPSAHADIPYYYGDGGGDGGDGGGGGADGGCDGADGGADCDGA